MMAVDKFIQQYVARTPASRALYERARNVLPGGVSGNAKFMKPHPVYVRRALGSRITDVDGNEYIDLLCGAGSAILGHGAEAIRHAVASQMAEAIAPIFATELEVRLAEKVASHMSYMELVRFVNSGSEATLMAIRAARAFTGRSRIARFEGNYHGQHDTALIGGAGAGGGPDHAPTAGPDCAGIPQATVDGVLLAPFNNSAAFDLIRANAKELAAVLVEPVAMFGIGAVPAEVEFLRGLRRVTQEHGIVLIFDEIVTGFRLGLGGAASYFGVTPDLGCIGKIVGGGFPIGGFGGRRDVMDKVITPTKQPSDLREKSFASGTFSGNPISMAAGLAQLSQLENAAIYEYIAATGAKLRDGLTAAAAEAGFEVEITGLGSMLHVHFSKEPVRDKRAAMRGDHARQYEFSMGMIANGVMLPPAHPAFVSAAHTDTDIDQVVQTARAVLAQMK